MVETFTRASPAALPPARRAATIRPTKGPFDPAMNPITILALVGAPTLAACNSIGTAGADDPVVAHAQDPEKKGQKLPDTVVLSVLDAKGTG